MQQGGTLTIEDGTLGDGSVNFGAGGGTATHGQADGGDIFLQGNEALTFAPSGMQTITGVIADMTGSDDPSGDTGAGSLIMDGTGTLVLDANNTFTGGITIDSGTVELATAGAGGTGPITFDPRGRWNSRPTPRRPRRSTDLAPATRFSSTISRSSRRSIPATGSRLSSAWKAPIQRPFILDIPGLFSVEFPLGCQRRHDAELRAGDRLTSPAIAAAR